MLENSEDLNTQAIELAIQGYYGEALACLKRAVTIDKENYLLWYNLGITFRDSGNLVDAKKALIQSYKLNDSDEDLLETLALVSFALEDFEDAFAYCYEGIDINPLNACTWNNLGVLFFSKQEYEEAAESFETAVSIYPHYYDALFNLRDTYKELGNKKGEEECIQALKHLKPRGNSR
ncbi:MAG: tetratricopeptide repeat protein [Treponemataceae bacterium]